MEGRTEEYSLYSFSVLKENPGGFHGALSSLRDRLQVYLLVHLKKSKSKKEKRR